jgi:hypothetical protein
VCVCVCVCLADARTHPRTLMCGPTAEHVYFDGAEAAAPPRFLVRVQILNLFPETVEEFARRQRCDMAAVFQPSSWAPFCFVVKEMP